MIKMELQEQNKHVVRIVIFSFLTKYRIKKLFIKKVKFKYGLTINKYIDALLKKQRLDKLIKPFVNDKDIATFGNRTKAIDWQKVNIEYLKTITIWHR